MIGESWKVYWNEYAKDTYVYGSDIWFHGKDDVEFHNDLMPPGTIIKRWYSKTNYQAMRIEPALPIIDGEGHYLFSADIQSDQPDGVLFKLVYYDRYGTEVGNQIVRDKEAEFQCPLKTYSYEVQLINGGISSFRFHSLTISEIENEE